jgi:UDP-N-acetylglucosamine/UDP-N-acetyl-alpha-D-glucosaminouronate 4-epimerase
MRKWLVTGAGGFIGSHLVETLLQRDESVVALDNFSTGRRENLKPFLAKKQFTLIEGDIRNRDLCRKACQSVDFVLHQAAQCSVPASIADPLGTHEINVTGFLNILLAAQEAGVKRLVFASSCAVYGDSKQLPNTEERAGNFLSPYALSKFMDELYAKMFAIETIGLRYFNVYGPRQDPNGAYAAVIPRWITALSRGEKVTIFGDGETTRDFVFVEDVLQANVLAATTQSADAVGQMYNVASGTSISLNALYHKIHDALGSTGQPAYSNFRPGDIRHSSADISKSRRLLGFEPKMTLDEGLQRTAAAYKL